MSLRDDLLQPIPGPNPGGTNLRYDMVYDRIKEARREDDDTPQGAWATPRKVADWSQVKKLASEALATKSKDLQLAAWLTEALVHQDSLSGLRAGLDVVRGLLELFWNDVYPALEDGDASFRAAPLEWAGRHLGTAVWSVPLNKSGHDLLKYKEARAIGREADAGDDEKKRAARQAALADGKLSLDDFDRACAATPKAWLRELFEEADNCLQTVLALDAMGQEKFGGEDAPSYSELVKALQEVSDVTCELLDEKLKVEPDPPKLEVAADQGAAVAPTRAPTPDAATQSAPLSAELTSVEDAAARIAGAARFLRHADPCHPASYLLLRGFRWGELRATGRDLDPKLLAAPPTRVRTHLKGLLLDAKWPVLLDAAEDVMAMPYGRGWLDLQRYEVTACERLGADYTPLATALRAGLAALLHDLPQLPSLTLMDDTPTANPETRAWLGQAGLLAGGGRGAAGNTPGQTPPGGPESAGERDRPIFDRATEAVRAGNPQLGIELLLQGAEQEPSARARFLCRSAAAGIMVNAGLEAVAQPILKELLDQIDAHKLEAWESGGTVAEALGLMYRCLRKTGGNEDLQTELYRRICRLDPLQAMAFPGGRGDDGAAGA